MKFVLIYYNLVLCLMRFPTVLMIKCSFGILDFLKNVNPVEDVIFNRDPKSKREKG